FLSVGLGLRSWLKMILSGRTLGAHIIAINFLLLLSCNMVFGTATDIFCLKSIKDSLEDPYGYLKSSWDFNNITEGFICRFTGVECWHPDENRVLNLKLSNMALKGQFPRAIRNCSSLTGLDLSMNTLSGKIPADIDVLLPFVTTLDLSSNNFSGKIPNSVANCSYLNSLKLDQNQLSGRIPGELTFLTRLKTFTVTNNLLTGPVPNLPQVPAESYANNSGLCGGPLPPCS
ncbi:probably inactive leucine-rich repeat receptor-like protein kinase At5g48380, partial [Neltuma alba]|uniref:probably inactive leucine-rich repeat receptor-like protein kinase At5g48380 n=1 Tax=Neltuma alba TaxID=207710 RepID=UPI0010A39CA4